jgi:K+-transporting ATPase ATPase B chain
MGASAALRRNLFLYGFGGVLVPFPAIWIIDRLLVLTHLA